MLFGHNHVMSSQVNKNKKKALRAMLIICLFGIVVFAMMKK